MTQTFLPIWWAWGIETWPGWFGNPGSPRRACYFDFFDAAVRPPNILFVSLHYWCSCSGLANFHCFFPVGLSMVFSVLLGSGVDAVVAVHALLFVFLLCLLSLVLLLLLLLLLLLSLFSLGVLPVDIDPFLLMLLYPCCLYMLLLWLWCFACCHCCYRCYCSSCHLLMLTFG